MKPEITPLRVITREIASCWTANWREAAQAFDFDLKGFTMRVEELKTLIEGMPKDSEFIRIYLAINKRDVEVGALGMHVVFCGVDEEGNDILRDSRGLPHTVFDLSNPCPPKCGVDSCLNSDIKCPDIGDI